MDLGAYSQIEELGGLADANGIDVPRLRGYRLMDNEMSISLKDIDKICKNMSFDVLEKLCRSTPFWSPHPRWRSYDRYTDRLRNYYSIRNQYGEIVDIRWDRIHGRKRKILKFEIKKAKLRVQKQMGIWNKYAGQKDVLYIHSRIGGGNWNYYGGNELVSQPWFIERVDDHFDRTYCDIYARIDERLIDHLKEEYHKSGIVMTEFLRSFDPKLPENICNELLKWSGDDESN